MKAVTVTILNTCAKLRKATLLLWNIPFYIFCIINKRKFSVQHNTLMQYTTVLHVWFIMNHHHALLSYVQHYSTTALRHYGTTALRHYSTTALRHYSTTALQHYSTTALQHYGTTALRHYSTTALRNYGTTALRHYSTTCTQHESKRQFHLVHKRTKIKDGQCNET